MEAFNMSYLSGREWGLIIGLFPICAIIDEITKAVYRATGYGERPKAVLKRSVPYKSSGSNKDITLEVKHAKDASNSEIEDRRSSIQASRSPTGDYLREQEAPRGNREARKLNGQAPVASDDFHVV